MSTTKNRLKFIKKMPFQTVGIILILLVAIALLWISNASSNKAIPAMSAQVHFEGEYRIGNGQWQNIIDGHHIPATKGDVTLRGVFHMFTPDGEYVGPLGADIPIAFYMDHINVTVYEGENEPYVHDNENPLFGSSACGEMWLAHSFTSDLTEPIELVIHNPHHFGNETAIDEMLSNVAIWRNVDFEKSILSMGDKERNAGIFFIIILFATAASDVATGSKRYEYYLDGIRVYSPLGENQVNASDIVKDAYGKEQNAVFKEVRDILLDYKDFNIDMEDSTDSKAGAVFIDTIKEGQGTGKDAVGVGKSTYEVGTFETYGPKNEVYLKGGQSIVLKVDNSNTYYVGLKSLDGKKVTANVSGISKAEPKQIEIAHSIDMYYQVTPIEGYIVIENASTGEEILSITQLRTTNLTEPAINSGILPVTQQEAVVMMARFALRMNPPVYEEPEDEELEGKEPVEKNPEENVQEKPDSGKKPSDNQIAHAGNISDNQQTTDKKPNATPSEQNALVDEEAEEEIVGGKDLVDEESEEVVQEKNGSKESEDSEKLTIWEKILAFFKNLFYNIATWIRNLIGGDEV